MTESFDFAKKIARQAVTEMVAQNVPPTPENYAVWYVHASGRNKPLSKRINALLKAKEAFDAQICSDLYEEFISDQARHGEIERQAFSAKNLMQDLFELINVMTSETSNYNQKLDGYIDRLSGKYQDEGIQKMVKELIDRTSTMRSSGDQLSDKLMESRKEVETLRENLERITEEATRDPLTGVGNRKAFDTNMEKFCQSAQEGEMDFSLLMLDIDHFKQFNDKFGHVVGDEVLKIVAKELLNAVKRRDIVARYGGEEFAIMLPETPLSGALAVAENLRKSIASKDLTRRDTKQSYGAVTISVGAAQYHPGKDSVNALIQRADEALYRSKKGGRNRVTQENLQAE